MVLHASTSQWSESSIPSTNALLEALCERLRSTDYYMIFSGLSPPFSRTFLAVTGHRRTPGNNAGHGELCTESWRIGGLHWQITAGPQCSLECGAFFARLPCPSKASKNFVPHRSPGLSPDDILWTVVRIRWRKPAHDGHSCRWAMFFISVKPTPFDSVTVMATCM